MARRHGCHLRRLCHGARVCHGGVDEVRHSGPSHQSPRRLIETEVLHFAAMWCSKVQMIMYVGPVEILSLNRIQKA